MASKFVLGVKSISEILNYLPTLLQLCQKSTSEVEVTVGYQTLTRLVAVGAIVPQGTDCGLRTYVRKGKGSKEAQNYVISEVCVRVGWWRGSENANNMHTYQVDGPQAQNIAMNIYNFKLTRIHLPFQKQQ